MLKKEIIIGSIIQIFLGIFSLITGNVFAVFLFFILSIYIIYIKIKIRKLEKKSVPVFYIHYKKILSDKILIKQKIDHGEYITKKEKHYIEININQIKEDIHALSIYLKYTNNTNIHDKIIGFQSFIHSYKGEIEKINNNYYKNKLNRYSVLFDSIEKYPLDEMQKKAILTPEESLLVIAGAGSGKTSTIIGKVKYLLEVKQVPKDEILLISFTSASAQEMKSRIKEKLSLDLDVMTFHKLGKNIVEEVIKTKVNILQENDKKYFRDRLFNTLLSDIHDDSPELFNKFFAYLIKPSKLTFDFKSIGEVENYRRENNITTLRERVNRSSIQGEYLKSMEEVEIANFLFLNGINYTYEKPYKIDTTNSEFGQYRPDFYLDDYDIYIEHYGIDKEGNVPKFFGDGIGGYLLANQKYKNGIEWKEKLHQDHKTALICTYSYENQTEELFKNLTENLRKKGVQLKRLNKDEVVNKVMPSIRAEYSNFMDLIFTFLGLYKSNSLGINDLYQRNDLLFIEEKINLKAKTFIAIFEKVCKYYEEHLKNLNVIDFDDMINNSTSYLNNNLVTTKYKYIIIDEFQDIGVGRYKLIDCIKKKNSAELFCVGDDWQSIYRFTGGDLNIFTHFEKYFPFGEKVFINKTYRYPQEVNDVTHKFITKNKAQIDKILESGNIEDPEKPIFNIINYKDDNHKKELLDLILLKYKKNITALGRYTSENKLVPKGIDFKTVHGSKGLESDYVVILNGNSGNYGFPSQKKDNSLLNLVLSEPDNYKFSEERRLFYVALTRAKKKTFILTKHGHKSSFIKELEDILGTKSIELEKNSIQCPICKKGELVSKNKYFKGGLGCDRFRHCKYKIITSSPNKKDHGKALSKLNEKYLAWILKNKNNYQDPLMIERSIYYEIEQRKQR